MEVGDWVGLGRELGRGFFQILSKQQATTQKLVMLTPHRSRWGTCILQSWTSGFNARKPVGLCVPTWVTLKNVPFEFLNVSADIAGDLGAVLGEDKRNQFSLDHRYCVGLPSGNGWKTKLTVENEFTKKEDVIIVDYGHLPIRCRLCLSTSHLVKDCPGRPFRSREEPEPSGCFQSGCAFGRRSAAKSTTGWANTA